MSSITSPHKTLILEHLLYQGDSNDCGPTTTATVLNALRKTNLEAKTMAKIMNKPRRRGLLIVVRRIPNWATFPWGFVDVFREYGLQARWRFRVTPEYLLERLERETILMPIIGSWKPLWAHVMTLVAVDENGRWGFANTQYDRRSVYWMSDEAFRKKWQVMGRLLVEIPGPVQALNP
jgi:hypothetical protein